MPFLDLVVRAAVEHWRDARRDARYAVRLLARAPGFTLAAVLCLALGTGLVTAMYAQVQATVLAALPGGVGSPRELVRIHRPVSFAVYDHLQAGAPAGVRLAGYVGAVPFTLDRGDGSPRRRIWGQLATPAYFEVLGVRAAAGRLFDASERVEGVTTVVMGDRLWRSQFGARPTIIGESIRVNGQLVTVIGIAPPGFVGAAPMSAAAELWVPTTASPRLAPELGLRTAPGSRPLDVIARLAPAVTPDHAERALAAIADRVEPAGEDPGRATGEPRIRLLPGGRMFPVRDADLPRAVGLPLVLVLLVLVMACGNVANMLLARGAARQRELSVRLALGASRSRIVRQLMTESVLLSVLGSLAGGLVAVWFLSLFGRMRPIIPEYVQYDVGFHWGAFAAAAMAAGVSTLGFSLAPSLRASRQDIQAALKPNAPTGLQGFRRFGLRNLVIYQQVAFSVLLLLLTGFVVVGWTRSASVDLGFRPAHLYALNLDPVRDGRSPAEAASIVERVGDRLRSTGGVTSVSFAQTVPLAMSGADLVMRARTDMAAGTRSLGSLRVDRVGAAFFETVGTPVRRGRTFIDADHTDQSRALVVNETMAASAWPGRDPLGQSLTLGEDTWEVVGVVGDMRSAFPLAPTLPAAFRPVTPAGFETPSMHGVTLVVRTTPGLDAFRVLRDVVRAVDPAVTVVGLRPMTEEVDRALFLARVATVVYGGMGVVGLLLAAVGLAGVTAYGVARRTREIGIRMALGARRADVLRLVLRESAAITLAGTLTGAGLAFVVTRALAGVVEALAETTRTSIADPTLLLGGPALLLTTALLACYVPARRATRIDPVTALRSE